MKLANKNYIKKQFKKKKKTRLKINKKQKYFFLDLPSI